MLFASEATIRAAILDVIDTDEFKSADMWAGDFDAWEVTEDTANEVRTSFVDAVVKRLAELMSPPHDHVRLENFCDSHKRQLLPASTASECGLCRTERLNGLYAAYLSN